MKIFRILFFLSFLTIVGHSTIAQAKFEFEKESHDFKKIAEGTVAAFDFRFKNIGTEPIVISNVRASCGCTTPFWTKEPVLPGQTGKITASYNSQNRPGSFNKTITITSNATEASKVLRIKGVVINTQLQQNAVSYTPQQLALSPIAKIDKKDLVIGKVEKGQVIPLEISISNPGKTQLVLSNLTSDCKCARFEPASTRIIPSGETKTVKILFSSNKLGSLKATVNLQSNDLKKPITEIRLNAEIVEALGNNSIIKNNKEKIKF